LEKQSKIQWVYAAGNNRELSARYDQWASDYDTELDRDFGYRAPTLAVEFVSRYVPREARILDAGAGTGLVGEILTEQGYHDLIGLDMSAGMLEEACRKNVYRELHQMVMGDSLAFDSDSFDAVVAVGVFTLGHAPASSFDELVRITRPGGHIVFTLRPDVYENDGFKERQLALEAEGKWKLVETSEKIQSVPIGEPDIYVQFWVYQVTPAGGG
jgi:predicted TPR repeat methyltransferase